MFHSCLRCAVQWHCFGWAMFCHFCCAAPCYFFCLLHCPPLCFAGPCLTPPPLTCYASPRLSPLSPPPTCRYLQQTAAGYRKLQLQRLVGVGSHKLQNSTATFTHGGGGAVCPAVARLLTYVYGDANRRVSLQSQRLWGFLDPAPVPSSRPFPARLNPNAEPYCRI